jgi:glucose-6-phosphate dehydrogenase assembly protein OpcA
MTTAEGERVTTRSWTAEDVDLGQVASELSKLHTELTHAENAHDEHPHPRNCVLNLVVAVSDEKQEAAVQAAVQAVASGHPLRAIILRRSSAEGEGLDAEITTQAHRLVRGRSVQLEQVTLKVRGQTAEHTASLVDPLLVPDVPTYLWWTGTPPLAEQGLRDALAACDVLIVDSAQFENLVQAFLDLAALAERLGGRLGFVDLRWVRQKPWRETLAQFFAPESRREMLAGLERVVVESIGEGTAGRVGGMLLGGWLMSALDWRLTDATSSTHAGSEVLLKRANGRMIQLTLRAVEQANLPPGALRSIHFDGHADGKEFATHMEVRPDRSDHAHVRIDIGRVETLHQRLAMPQPTDSGLLLHALSAVRRDGVYFRSLDAAAKLLDALR